MVCRRLGVALAATLLAGVGEGAAAPVRAIPAHEVVNRLGVQTHFAWPASIYRQRSPDVKLLLGELGVRSIRDALGNAPANLLYADLWREYGIRILAVADARTPSEVTRVPAPDALPSVIAGAKLRIGTQAILGFEGLNEPNQLEIQNGIMDWPTTLRTYMSRLNDVILSDPDLRHLPILAPAMSEPANPYWHERAGSYSDLSDLGNGHIYGTYFSFSQKLDEVLPNIRQINSGPAWASEFGWQTAANNGGAWIDEGSKVKYLSRAILELGLRSNVVQRGFIYQLVDHIADPGQLDRQAHFGLVDYQLKPKASFYAVRNMMHILCDDALAGTPGTLDFRLQGDTRNVRTLLMQKRNGAYYLAVWLEVQSVRQNKPVVVPPQRLSISFRDRMQQVQVFRPADPASDLTLGRQPRFRFTSTSSVTVDVGDHPLILEVVPRRVAAPGPITGCTFRGT